MANMLPLEIWQDILDKLDFISQIRLCQVSKSFYQILRITDFYNIEHKYLIKLTDDIIKNYPYIQKLRAYPKITDAALASLNLKKLYASNNPKITLSPILAPSANMEQVEKGTSRSHSLTNVNHMDKLEILYASWNCGINDAGLASLNLKKLDACYNPNITNRI